MILLYLLDNNTSFIILASSAVGLAIEFWKVPGPVPIVAHDLAALSAQPGGFMSAAGLAVTDTCANAIQLTPAVGCCMQITKAMHVTLDTSGSIPRLRFRNRETYMSSKTAEYDDQVTQLFMFKKSSVPCTSKGRAEACVQQCGATNISRPAIPSAHSLDC